MFSAVGTPEISEGEKLRSVSNEKSPIFAHKHISKFLFAMCQQF